MEVGTSGLVFALSDALDAVEKEFIGAFRSHAKRVAYIAALMNKAYGYSLDQMEDLSICAVMHDSALTKAYLLADKTEYPSIVELNANIGRKGQHCLLGQECIKDFPFNSDAYKNVILYHHEEADGNGPFHKKEGEIPMAAEILHLADSMDNWTRAYGAQRYHWTDVKDYLAVNEGSLYSKAAVHLFLTSFNEQSWEEINTEDIKSLLSKVLTPRKTVLSDEEMKNVCGAFASIVDSKSHFTQTHSNGIAEKAYKMGQYYQYSQETCDKLLFAGYLHDIGKMMIPNTILEKPAKLTLDEYAVMKMHAAYSYLMLSQISGIDDIRDWACYHHERLDGKGYPFGKKGAELNKNERLLAVIDVYQALREERPYRASLPHKEAMRIIGTMVASGGLDKDIAQDVDRVFGK